MSDDDGDGSPRGNPVTSRNRLTSGDRKASIRPDVDDAEEEGEEVDYEPLTDEEPFGARHAGVQSKARGAPVRTPEATSATTTATQHRSRWDQRPVVPAMHPPSQPAERTPRGNRVIAQGVQGTGEWGPQGRAPSVPLATSSSTGLHHVTMFTQMPTIDLTRELTRANLERLKTQIVAAKAARGHIDRNGLYS